MPGICSQTSSGSTRVPRCATSSDRCSRTTPHWTPRPPSGRPAPQVLSNIHPELSSFVGREADIAQIVELLQTRRLVSITGPGGIGKTRIATEIALHPGRVWRDGTWLVELGVEAGERAVTAAFHRTFGPRLGHTGGDEAIDWLTTGLATTELLIVLDNCEHVLAEAAAVASDDPAVVPRRVDPRHQSRATRRVG